VGVRVTEGRQEIPAEWEEKEEELVIYNGYMLSSHRDLLVTAAATASAIQV